MRKRRFSKGPADIVKAVRLTESMHQALEYLADDQGVKLAPFIQWVLDDWLQEYSERVGPIPGAETVQSTDRPTAPRDGRPPVRDGHLADMLKSRLKRTKAGK